MELSRAMHRWTDLWPGLMILAVATLASAGCLRTPPPPSEADGHCNPATEQEVYEDVVVGDDTGADDVADVDCWNDWEGPFWGEFVEGFEQGWLEACDEIMDLGDGYALYYGTESVDHGDCTGNVEDPTNVLDLPNEVPEQPYDEGYSEGERMACETVFGYLAEDAGSDDGTLYYDGEQYSQYDC